MSRSIRAGRMEKEMLDTGPPTYHVHISGNRRLGNELLCNFFAQSADPPFTCSLNSSCSFDFPERQTDQAILVLQDCHDFDRQSLLRKLQDDVSALPSSSYLVCINVQPDQKIEKEAIAIGARGIFYVNDSLATLKKGIEAILNGELWFSRDTLSTSLSSFLHNHNSQSHQNSPVVSLTRREKEILRLVASGISNERIAKRLCISPFTVKTHIRNIYRKIDVPSRIQAIFWVNENYLLLRE